MSSARTTPAHQAPNPSRPNPLLTTGIPGHFRVLVLLHRILRVLRVLIILRGPLGCRCRAWGEGQHATLLRLHRGTPKDRRWPSSSDMAWDASSPYWRPGSQTLLAPHSCAPQDAAGSGGWVCHPHRKFWLSPCSQFLDGPATAIGDIGHLDAEFLYVPTHRDYIHDAHPAVMSIHAPVSSPHLPPPHERPAVQAQGAAGGQQCLQHN